MSSEKQIEFTKENIDTYLKEVAKEYRKQIGKNTPAEMILIGGASILVNYGFRDMTTDIDAECDPSRCDFPFSRECCRIAVPNHPKKSISPDRLDRTGNSFFGTHLEPPYSS